MTKAKESNNCLGLIIRIKKYAKKIGLKNKVSENKDVILGYYDALEIEKVSRWYDFSPRNGYPTLNMDLLQDFLTITHYPLKLLFPADTSSEEGTSFNYSGWKNAEVLLDKSPCMTIILLNLTDRFKEQTNDALKVLQEQICRISKEDELKSANCCVLHSLGYSDFCILLADQSWDFALDLIEKLHSVRVDNVPILSTDYMMPVFHNVNSSTQDMFPKGRLSIRINLEPGCTSQMLANCIPEGVEISRTSGGTDCLLIANTPQSTSALFNSITKSSDANQLPLNLLIDLSSALQLEILDKSAPQEIIKADYSSVDKVITEFSDAIKFYRNVLRKYKQHLRQTYALDELAVNIKNLCSQHHTGDIRQIVLDFISNFSKCLYRCCNQLISEPLWDDLLYCTEECVDDFCLRVDSFLADLSRSDCYFMERERYNHPSVSSTTSLLLAYNRWLNRFSETIQLKTLPENPSSYKFLVTSGGCDQTSTDNLFSFLEPEVENCQRKEDLPLLIQMSEMSLFDYSGTILRVTHECMHYCGERYRGKRIWWMIEFIAAFYGKTIANILFGEQYLHSVKGALRIDGSDVSLLKKMGEMIQCKYENLLNELGSKISIELKKYLSDGYPAKPNDTDCLARKVKSNLQEILITVFAINKFEDMKITQADFAKFLFENRQTYIARFYQECNSVIIENGCHTVYCAFLYARQDVLNNNRQDDFASYYVVQNVLPALLMSAAAAKDDSVVGDIPRYNIYNMLDSVVDVFRETFADVAACTALNVQLSDYVLMHVYEDWDLNRSLRNSFSNQFRIPVTLLVCFSDMVDEDGLTDEAQVQLRTAIERLVEHGLPQDRLDADTLIQRLETFLQEYTMWKYAGDYLYNYLIECQNLYKRVDLTEIQSEYQRIRLLNIDPSNFKILHEKIEEMEKHFVNLEHINNDAH